MIAVTTGDKYNRLTIIEEIINSKPRRFKCKCDCGIIKVIALTHLRSGHTQSCGCKQKDIMRNNSFARTHGISNTRINKIWHAIEQRCNNERNPRYQDYGGRGIECQWNTFEEFYNDMIDTYQSHLTIERRENDSHYCKSNCYWATYKEQANNRRSNL